MTTKELIKKVVTDWHFPILNEEDFTIVTRFQINYVQIGALQDGRKGIAVTMNGLFRADDEREMRLALKTCNEINFRMMQVKLYIDDDNDLVISSEFFYETEEDVKELLYMALTGVVNAKKFFLSQYKEMEEEDSLLEDIINREEQNP